MNKFALGCGGLIVILLVVVVVAAIAIEAVTIVLSVCNKLSIKAGLRCKTSISVAPI